VVVDGGNPEDVVNGVDCFVEEKDDVDDDAELRGPAGVSFVVVVVPATAESLLIEASSFVRAYRACAWSFFPWR
jgi:hypothetical protein